MLGDAPSRGPHCRRRHVPESTDRRYRPRIEGLFARIERWTDTSTRRGALALDLARQRHDRLRQGRRLPDRRSRRDADPAHLQLADLRELRRQGQRDRLRVQARGRGAASTSSQAHERNRAGRSRREPLPQAHPLRQPRPSRLVEPDLAQHDGLDVRGRVRLRRARRGRARRRTTAGDVAAVADDPFSSYRAGFEVRTYRLCRRVLMFHHFPDEPDVGADCLVRSTDLAYRSRRRPGRRHAATRLPRSSRRSPRRGYRAPRRRRLSCTRSLPPLEFEYSRAAIDDEVRELDADEPREPAGGRRRRRLPAGSTSTARACPASSPSRRARGSTSATSSRGVDVGPRRGRAPARRPSVSRPTSRAADAQLLDLAGDGQLDLVALDGPTPGFYERTTDERLGRRSRAFALAARASTGRPEPRVRRPRRRRPRRRADHARTTSFTWYPSLGEDGFGRPRTCGSALDEETRAARRASPTARSPSTSPTCPATG